MWIQFPEGTHGITVELQQFHPQAVDENGREYFHIPDHFAGTVLDLPGFVMKNPPNAAEIKLPEDQLPTSDALMQVSAQVENLKLENEGLRAAYAEIRVQRDDLRVENNNLKGEISQLNEELDTLKNSDKSKGT